MEEKFGTPHNIFKEENIEIEEHTFNIEVKQEVNEVNPPNDLIRNINSISPIKPEIKEDLNSDLIIKASASVNIENNVYNVRLSKLGKQFKYSKEKSWRQTKLQGRLLNGKNIKKQDTINGIIICVLCGNLYTKQVEYFSHYLLQHYLRRKKLCTSESNRRNTGNFTNLNEDVKYDIEIVKHELIKEFEGTRTSAQFNNIDNYKSNLWESVENTQLCSKNPFKSEMFGKTFSSENKLNRDLRCHTAEKPFNCNVCSKSFSNKNGLMEHLRCHNEEKPFKCDICTKNFSNESDLSKHSVWHKCLKAFSQKGERCHTGEKPFSCDICLKSYSLKGHLNEHIRSHTGEKPFKCDVCLKGFSRKCDLNTHLRWHTGEKPFKCDICTKCFARKCDLNIHVRCHTGEKPYKCEICSKSFAQRSQLNSHMRCHTGEKPFKCEICLKYFSYKSTFNRHLPCHPRTKEVQL